MENSSYGGTCHGKKSRPTWRSLGLVQGVLRAYQVPFEPKLMNRCRPEKKDTEEHGKVLEGHVPDKKAKGCKVEGRAEGESQGRSARG